MLFYPCYLCGFQLYLSFGGGIIEVCAILTKKWGSEARVCPNRGAFICPCVGAYWIRLTDDPFMGRMVQMIDRWYAFLSPAGPFGGAYAIRPYPDGRKMIAVGACHGVGYEKRGAMPAFYRLTWRRSYACDLLLWDSAYHYILGLCTTCGPVPDQCIIQPYFLLNIQCGAMIELYLK